MTDNNITADDRRRARRWALEVIAQAEAEDRRLNYHNAARVLLADVPEPGADGDPLMVLEVRPDPDDFTEALGLPGYAVTCHGELNPFHAAVALSSVLAEAGDRIRADLEAMGMTGETPEVLAEVLRMPSDLLTRLSAVFYAHDTDNTDNPEGN